MIKRLRPTNDHEHLFLAKNIIGTDSNVINPVLEIMTRSNSGKKLRHPPIQSEPLAKIMFPFDTILY